MRASAARGAATLTAATGATTAVAATTLTATLAEQNSTDTFSQTFSNINLQTILGGTNAFIGFTGATGGENAIQQISNFSFRQPEQTTYANPVTVNAGASPTVAVAAVAAAPTISMGPLTLNAGSTLNVTAATGTPANQAYGLTFASTTLENEILRPMGSE